MNYDFTDREIDFLKRQLLTDFGNLRMQISSTDTHDFREELKQDEATLRGILLRFGVEEARKGRIGDMPDQRAA